MSAFGPRAIPRGIAATGHVLILGFIVLWVTHIYRRKKSHNQYIKVDHITRGPQSKSPKQAQFCKQQTIWDVFFLGHLAPTLISRDSVKSDESPQPPLGPKLAPHAP